MGNFISTASLAIAGLFCYTTTATIAWYRFDDGKWTLGGSLQSGAITGGIMLTPITTPLTTELGRAWRRLDALTRTTVRPHHAAFEHRHCNNNNYDCTMDPEWSAHNSSQKYARWSTQHAYHIVLNCYNYYSTSRCVLILICNRQMAPLLMHNLIS